MSGKYALIIAITEYTDRVLTQLPAPGQDAKELARVLDSRDICAFDDVIMLSNETASKVSKTIDHFLSDRKPADLLVLYFSGHGILDEDGSLYLAVRDTERARLDSTAIKSDFIRAAMDRSRSKRQILILDCCNSSMLAQGTKAEIGGSVGTAAAFEGRGYGRVVLTASDSTQFAWQGDQMIGETENSLFTNYFVKGLEGEADLNGDERITIDELYDYVYEKIVSIPGKQTPIKWSYKPQGEIVLRQNIRTGDTEPVPLSDDLLSAMHSSFPYIRESAVSQLDLLLKSKNPEVARSARLALQRIAAEDDSRRVAQAAAKALERSPHVGQALQKAGTDLSTAPTRTAQLRHEKLDQEKADLEKRLQEEQSDREKIEAEPKAKEASQPAPAKSRATPIGIGIAAIAMLAIGYAAIRFLPSLFPSASTATPLATQAPVVLPARTESLPTSTAVASPSTEVVTMTASAPPSEIVDSKGMPMIFVPTGDFMMGSDISDAADEKPSHTVFLDNYYIDKFEVTNAWYKACVDSGKCDPPKHPYFFPESPKQVYYGNPQYDNYPVIYVDWNMAEAYCEWRSARLPTEAEWEKAARGVTDDRIYPWGTDLKCQQANYLKCVNTTSAVGSYEAGKSPYGAYDMAGNVLEWVADWYSANYYQTSPRQDPLGPDSGQSRVVRGGSWTKFDVRVTNRIGVAVNSATFDTGFRCASSVP